MRSDADYRNVGIRLILYVGTQRRWIVTEVLVTSLRHRCVRVVFGIDDRRLCTPAEAQAAQFSVDYRHAATVRVTGAKVIRYYILVAVFSAVWALV